MYNRTFWKTIKSFLTNKGCRTNHCFDVEKDGDIAREEKVLMKLFNENYIHFVEISSRNKPSFIGDCEDSARDDTTIDKIISKYSLHPSVQKLKIKFL